MTIDLTSDSKWLELFLDFIGNIEIDSKESGVTNLRKKLYSAQFRLLEKMDDGMREGVRMFIILKARQLGISTISLALDLFWLMVFPGMQGAIVTDTEPNRDKFRILIDRYWESIPQKMKGNIKLVKNNRSNLVLSNGSVLDYLVAGTKKGNAGLGRSRALNFVHATEMSSWGDPESLASLKAAMAQKHPNRLYIFESTAKGFNLFYEMWEKAKESPSSQKPIFLGWWSKDEYSLPKSDVRFDEFWDGILSEDEKDTQKQVLEFYQHEITPEQWAWYRWYEATESAGEGMMQQEFPSTEEEAFISTGTSFFPRHKIGADLKRLHEHKPLFKAYKYHMGEDFAATEITPVETSYEAELRVWEPPNPSGEYIIGIDPAYGRNDNKDNHCVEIYRCYADKLVQVAEYATHNPETFQAAWAVAHLAGWYRNVVLMLEQQGPGQAIHREMKHLRQLMDAGKIVPENGQGLQNVFGNVRWFVYNRYDSMGGGSGVYNWQCLALDTKLPTPEGWTTMGEVKDGDKLIDDQGNPCNVIVTSPVQIGKPCFEIEFDDGTKIIADDTHRWSTIDDHQRARIVATVQLRVGKHRIKIAGTLKTQEAILSIDPYVLGAWLGDGCSRNSHYYVGEQDREEMAKNISSRGYAMGEQKIDSTIYRQNIFGLHKNLREAGLMGNKHIPAAYLRASEEQRLLLLQGLMDTDGSSGGNGGPQCSFTTILPGLSQDFSELLRSLGIKSKHCVRKRTLKYDSGESVCSDQYQFWFTPPDGMRVFMLKRKQENLDKRKRSRKQYHRIVKITPVSSEPVKCIQVDSPSHLYLASEGMIPTHNTNVTNKITIMNQLRDAYSTNQLEIRSLPLMGEMQTVEQDGANIEASGRNKDDRVFATALVVRAWIDIKRPTMITLGKTLEAEMKKEAMIKNDPRQTLVGNVIAQFYAEQESKRGQARAKAMAYKPRRR